MNTELEKLFSRYKLSEKDRYEYMQIFSLLSPDKKRVFVENAEGVICEILQMRQSLRQQQEILMGETLSRIEEKLREAKKKTLEKNSYRALNELKESLK